MTKVDGHNTGRDPVREMSLAKAREKETELESVKNQLAVYAKVINFKKAVNLDKVVNDVNVKG